MKFKSYRSLAYGLGGTKMLPMTVFDSNERQLK